MSKKVLLAGVDGYIGTALVQRLLVQGYQVLGLDNFQRRESTADMGSTSATPILPMVMKEEQFKTIGNFEFIRIDIAQDIEDIERIIKSFNPDVIVNLAHIPSGPYSMIDRDYGNLTLMNNIIGTNNILWAIKEHCPDCHYVTIGTTGEYDHYSNIDIEEGYITIEHEGRTSNEMIYPRRPGSIYHTSKVSSTYLIDLLTRSWGLKTTDIMQSVVFGAYTDEIEKTKIYTRFDSDESNGTVINRFIVQAMMGVPLTVYGEGNHQRGFLSLNDSVQALMLAIENEPDKGKVRVWNQLSEWHSMNDLAKMVKEVGESKGLKVNISHIPTPRNEFTGDHYYKYKTDVLESLGYNPTRTIKEEIEYCFKVIDPNTFGQLKNVVIPQITWK